MKKVFKTIMLFSLIAVATPSFAQLSNEQKKERQEIQKMTRDEVRKKASKAARKEAKTLQKQGWLVPAGALPLDKQLERSYNMQYEISGTDMLPQYFWGEAMSIGETYDAAKMQATELAKQNLAGQIQTEVTALIENTVSNQQLSKEQAVSITQSIETSKSLIAQRIGRTIPVVELYRVKDGLNKEVIVRIAYNSETALSDAKKVLIEEMAKKGENMQQILDAIMGLK